MWMKNLLRQGAIGVLVLAAMLFLHPVHSHTQGASARRLVNRTAPAYPALARSLALEGVVKVDALVAADGSVKTVDVKGGHPVLAQAAANAVRNWKWEPASRESHELVEVKFAPE
jgi:TonB family protein